MNAKQLAKWKARGGAAPKVIGIHGPLPVDRTPMNPADIEFKPKRKISGTCRGCLFENQFSNICNKAIALAVRSGIGNCEVDQIIYIKKEIDQRQISLIDGEPNDSAKK